MDWMETILMNNRSIQILSTLLYHIFMLCLSAMIENITLAFEYAGEMVTHWLMIQKYRHYQKQEIYHKNYIHKPTTKSEYN